MSTKRENILAYVATALAATAGVAGHVYRSRPEAVRLEDTPCLLIEPIQDLADYNTMDFINWTLSFRVNILIRGATPDSLADPIYKSLYSILMADRSLGGRCQDFYPGGVNYLFTEGDKSVLIQSCIFTCIYRTQASNPEA